MVSDPGASLPKPRCPKCNRWIKLHATNCVSCGWQKSQPVSRIERRETSETRRKLLQLEPRVVYRVATAIKKSWPESYPICQIWHSDLALVVTIAFDYLAAEMEAADEEPEVAA